MELAKPIVVGTDFSRPADRAVARAAMLAAERGAALRIIHVAARVDRAALRRLGLDRGWSAGIDPELTTRLDAALALARSLGAPASARALIGAPVATLREEAARLDAALLVVGCRGERSLRDRFLGTTAERLMESWRGDLLLVKTPARRRYTRALACVALAPTSVAVVKCAQVWAAPAQLHVLHVYETPLARKLMSRGATSSVLKEYRDTARELAAASLAELLGRLAAPGGPRAQQHLRRGYPPTVILRVAAQVDADLVAIGKNQSRARALFLGSTAKQVLRETSADVLLSAGR